MDKPRDHAEHTSPQREAALQEMLSSADRYLACRDRVLARSPWAERTAPVSLADAIERDFAGFDMERAEAEFRAALAALTGSKPSPPDGTVVPPIP